jgi:RimJ/RimL family protein N-acetyltransferase
VAEGEQSVRLKVIELAVFAENRTAKHLYEKFGFRELGLRPLSIKRGERYIDECLMSLIL